MKAYKLTNQNLQTHKSYQWKLGEKRTTSGEGELCGPGWLHFYTDPRLAVILNPIHAGINNPRLFEVEVGGQCKEDRGVKVGYTEATLIKEIPLPEIPIEKKIEFAIRCSLVTAPTKQYVEWAKNWLNGTDRSESAAYVAVSAVSVSAAAYAAAKAAYFAADAADAADAAASFSASAAVYAAVYAADAAYDAAKAANIDFISILNQCEI
jgi:hypothetical protein